MDSQNTGCELPVTDIALADSSVVPMILRIEYGNGPKPHLSVIIEDGGEERRVHLSITRENKKTTAFSKAQNDIARNVPLDVARAFVETLSVDLGILGRKIKETPTDTKHGKLLVFYVVGIGDDKGAEVFERMDTKNARTPIVASK